MLSKRATTWAWRSVRHVSGATAQASSSSQRDLRERAIAESLAKEEEELSRLRRIRELKEQTVEKISTLNKTPVSILQERFERLQSQLDNLPEKKVKQLDQELEEFLSQHMDIPYNIIANHPWSERPNEKKSTLASIEGASSSSNASKTDSEHSSKIRSTSSGSFTSQFPRLKPTPDYKPYSEQELYLRQLQHSRQSGSLGSAIKGVYNASNEVKRPAHISDTTIASLMAAGCHLGHSVQSYRASTQPFIYGTYNGIHIIDLHETMAHLKRASNVIRTVAAQGGIIVYVGTSKNWEQQRAVEEAARRSNGYYVSKRWLPGTITNFREVTKQVSENSRVEVDMADQPTNRELTEENYKSILKPDLVVLLNPVDNRNCIKECISARIPTIGLCDTNMEPSLLTYAIPCNDDSMRATSLMAGILSRAAQDGVNERRAAFKAMQQRS